MLDRADGIYLWAINGNRYLEAASGAMVSGIAGALPLATLMVQEGGYLCAELGDNLSAFLNGFEKA